MKFRYSIQQYQTDAVKAVTDVFAGQIRQDPARFTRDTGNSRDLREIDDAYLAGYRNADILLEDAQILENIRRIQASHNIKQSQEIVRVSGKYKGRAWSNTARCHLDVEMETATGKTYVYIKTMFELNKQYGWSKFIVVVPSIAIREGVKKSLETMCDHFREQYGKVIQSFVYDSKRLPELDAFSSSADITVMIINTQAFARDFNPENEDKLNEENKYQKKSAGLIIYDKRDDFGSRRPIDVIAANRPIIIMDEPQKMGGDATQSAICQFHPLFCLYYSATHKTHHNLVYALDAVDAYNMRLVKKIEVKGIDLKNLPGTDSYLLLEGIILSPSRAPQARIELEVQRKTGVIKREAHLFEEGDSLFEASSKLEQYKDLVITEISPSANAITLSSGLVLEAQKAAGNIHESDLRRIQIRETIISHFDKEEELFNRGIKTLSLFFIDEVAKYRQYGEDGSEMMGEYGRIFEEEYLAEYNQRMRSLLETPYSRWLASIPAAATHRGYFSIDKKGHAQDSEVKRGSEFSDDISAYDLILKNKERLLSFEEPTRFIFSHSALREGWDNPNVFQICTLRQSGSDIAKRQEVGRGMRLCLDQSGRRMDAGTLGESVHAVNKLTVVAGGSYASFVKALQEDIRNEGLYERPTKITLDYFRGKSVRNGDQTVTLNGNQATGIYHYLVKNSYIDDMGNGTVTQKFRDDDKNGTLAPLPEHLRPMSQDILNLVRAVFDESILSQMIEDGSKPKVIENKLNANFRKKEFQELWAEICHKHAYTVHFDSEELIRDAVRAIEDELHVSELQYVMETGEQEDDMSEQAVKDGTSFVTREKKRKAAGAFEVCRTPYDLVGKIARGATLTRRTAAAILCGISDAKLGMFRANPEEFISEAVRLIRQAKATLIVDHIAYDTLEDTYDSAIFTQVKHQSLDKAIPAKKHIQDYVFTDGTANISPEWKFTRDLEAAPEVSVYAKLPKGFAIPTPVGDYSPDWAIAFHKGTVKHIFFIAETKGTMNTLELRPVEKAKLNCALSLFNGVSTSKVRYHNVTDYDALLKVMKDLP